MKIRFTWVVATAALFMALAVMVISARAELRLVIVSYTGWEQLQQLASWGLEIIHYQVDHVSYTHLTLPTNREV